MNKQGPNGISWCDYTWNPVTGCLHGCPYCYARRIAERFGDSFEPALHEDRLADPARKRKPAAIFVCSMADLWGAWVPKEWIEAVLETVCVAHHHRYLFLTKAPENYWKWRNHFGGSVWLGATADTAFHASNFTNRLAQLGHPQTFISAEPLLEDIAASINYEGIKLCIIGAQTGPGAVVPEREWVERLITRCRDEGVMIFLKDSILKLWPALLDCPELRQLPWKVGRGE